jgi:general L-amino acid transport system substrate-binding protein
MTIATVIQFAVRLAVTSVIVAASAALSSAQTLSVIKQRGMLICGVSEGVIGFSSETDKGWEGFDVDLCRALAAAVFNDPNEVRYVPLNAEDRFTALQTGAIDVLSRNSTWTMSLEVERKLLLSGGHVLRRAGLSYPQDFKCNVRA